MSDYSVFHEDHELKGEIFKTLKENSLELAKKFYLNKNIKIEIHIDSEKEDVIINIAEYGI